MDFVRMGATPYDTTYFADTLIEGYESLIWTERYQTFGEFELKTFDVKNMLAKLPAGVFVSHLETKEVMVVETHAIDWEGEGADARPQLTIKGRSVIKVLEERWVESSYQAKRRMRKKMSATSALGTLLFNAVDNNSGWDVTRVGNTPWTTLDDIPNLAITESVANEGSLRWFMLEQGILWPQFEAIMKDANLGIRAIRPGDPVPVTVVTVASDSVNRGRVDRLAAPSTMALRFDLYQGLNRSGTVKFSQLQGHLDSPNYLKSIADMRTVIEMVTDQVGVNDVYRAGQNTLSGWERRTGFLDFGKPEIPEKPNAPDALGRRPTAAQRAAYQDALSYYYTLRAEWNAARTNVNADFKAEGKLAALAELKRLDKIDMIAGDISLVSPYTYKKHYDLGDTVSLVGDYGPETLMMVAEYVRTEDANGDRGFPGLVVPGVE